MNTASKEAFIAYVEHLQCNEALSQYDRDKHARLWAELIDSLGAFGLKIRGHLGADLVIESRDALGTHPILWTVCDNGGELNVDRVNAAEIGRSVPYTAFRAMLDGGTMAYRVRCVVDDDAVDYGRSYADALETLRAHQGPNK
jgi:hypothetical protein